MSTTFDGNDPQVLQAFLYDLISKVKQPEGVELLVEVILNIQQPASIPRPTLSPSISIGHPATRKQARSG